MAPEKKGNSGGVAPKDEVEELLQKLEKRTNWDGRLLVKYQGFWIPLLLFRSIFYSQKNFAAVQTDILLASMPKSGTTWLKALCFAVLSRRTYATDKSPLLTSSPQLLVPSLELNLFSEQENPDFDHIPSPRLLHTHVPFNLLAESIGESACRIIYICRNPLDQFISYRFFSLDNKTVKNVEPLSIEKAFDEFCCGVLPFGPIWDHILGYWNAHLKNPQHIMFLKYEDLQEDILSNLKKIAEFIGVPFSQEEEKQGMMEEIAKLCSFETLSNLEVNKSGKIGELIKFSSFFRKGVVGDWKNYLTPEMAHRLSVAMETKLQGSGLKFNI